MEDLKRRGGWVLPAVLLAIYLLIKLQGWGYARQSQELERDLNRLRPALSAMVLAQQLERTQQACAGITRQVRRLDLKNAALLEQLSRLPASITLTRLENRTRLKVPLQEVFTAAQGRPEARLQAGLRVQGTLRAGVRDPESVLVRWAGSLQGSGNGVKIRRLFPSPRDPDSWIFEMVLEEA